jgi:hypothetical protein
MNKFINAVLMKSSIFTISRTFINATFTIFRHTFKNHNILPMKLMRKIFFNLIKTNYSRLNNCTLVVQAIIIVVPLQTNTHLLNV